MNWKVMNRSSAILALVMAVTVMTDSEAIMALNAGGNDDDRFQSYPVGVNIGTRGYLVPRNYLVNIRYDKRTNRDTEAMLRALWPGLEPLTPETENMWDRRIPDRQIFINIRNYGKDGYEQLQNRIRAGNVNPTPLSGPFNLVKYSKSRPSGAKSQLFVPKDGTVLTPKQTPIVFQCDDPTSTKAKKLFDVEILCIVDYELSDSSWLNYKFFLENLENWQEIDRSVRDLVDSFRK